MKTPTKRIFYHLEVTRGIFDTEMPIRARLYTLPARRSAHPRTSTHVTSTSSCPLALAHLQACRPPAPARTYLRTKKPGSGTLPGF